MGLYVPVWSYMQVDATYVGVVGELTEQGWEPFAASSDRTYVAPGFVEGHILHLRRPTGRTVRIADDD